MKICSLLPSATEILFALGAGDDVVGVSHECAFPPEAQGKRCVVTRVIDQDARSSEVIDGTIREHLARGESLYQVDVEGLRQLRPDLVVTQELCDVCAVGHRDILTALGSLPSRPKVLSLHPHTLHDVLDEIILLGEATGRGAQAVQLVHALRRRIEQVQHLVADRRTTPRVFCLEWLRPLMASGHWIPEMIALAGGLEVLGRIGEPSRYVEWPDVVAAQPEVLVVMPCGFPIERTKRELSLLRAQPGWDALPAVRCGQAYLVDGPAYFNCSGPRLVDGVEILAGLIHPARCGHLVPVGATERLEDR